MRSGARAACSARNPASLPGERPLVVADLNRRFEGWLPGYMAGAGQ